MEREKDDIDYRILCGRVENLREELIGAGYALEALARLMEREKEMAVVRLISKDLDRAVANAGVILRLIREQLILRGGHRRQRVEGERYSGMLNRESGGESCESEA